MHVIAADADAVELGHLPRAIAEDVAHDAHARPRRIDVGVAHHELLEDVVLDGALQLFRWNALFLRGHDEEGHDGQHGAVHGHAHAHLVQRDAVEENLHVLHAADGHTGLAHIALHTRVIAVVAAVRGQIEGDAQSHLSGGEVAAVERVARLGGTESSVLPNGPRTDGVHAAVGAAQVGRDAGGVVQVLQPFEVCGGVAGFQEDVFSGRNARCWPLATRGWFGSAFPVGQRVGQRCRELFNGV